MSEHEKIDYIEFQAADLERAKAFYTQVFDWEFTDYGPEYCSFSNAGVYGGIRKSEKAASASEGSVLVVLYSQKLEETQAKIELAGGRIIQPVFDFPGGRRFHFTDPHGNEFAVWSDN